MSNNDQRAAFRLPCAFPMRLFNEEVAIDAVSRDISRKGVRIQVPGAALGVHRLSSLVQVARRVREVLGDTFSAHLHHELLGNLVHKRLRPIRIGQRDWVSPDVELGCRIDEGISDEEAGMLGLALPVVGSDEVPEALEAVVEPTVRTPAPTARGDHGAPAAPTPPPRRYYVEGRADAGRVPFRVELDGVTSEGAVLRIDSLAALELDGDVSDVTRFVIAFDEAYGTVITLRALDGSNELWRGPVQLRQVELPAHQEGQAVISVAFESELPESLVETLSAA